MVMLQTSPVTTGDFILKHRLKKNNQKRFGERLASGGLKNEAWATGSSTQPSQEEPLRRVGMAKTKGLAPKEICTAGTETPTRQFPKKLYPKPSGPLRDSKSSWEQRNSERSAHCSLRCLTHIEACAVSLCSITKSTVTGMVPKEFSCTFRDRWTKCSFSRVLDYVNNRSRGHRQDF